MRLPAPFSGRRRQSSTPPRTDPPEVPTQQELEAALLARKITQVGLAGPALVLLHAFKPLAWIGGQMLWALEPFLVGPRTAGQPGRVSPGGLARFLEREGSVAEVIALLESPSDVEQGAITPKGHPAPTAVNHSGGAEPCGIPPGAGGRH